MNHYIVKNADGDIVGKYNQINEPQSPDNGTVEEVNHVDNYTVDEWVVP